MKTIYTLKTSFMNGTVTMMTDVANFTDRKVAEETEKTVKEKNKSQNIYTEITETYLYENRDEVPILKEN